ncbi:MAG: hypothetical protein M1821_007322 [Bathelium mastoideum]|nr:MAG: hypothetical protein M1821_007322 [Bathelium mastoideum]KAI9694826.1 MAG: hypothetical protein M1822_000442 [Bathelium mastoideum]
MPKLIPATSAAAPSRQSRFDNLVAPDRRPYRDPSASSEALSSPIHLSQLSSRQPSASRTPSPLTEQANFHDHRDQKEQDTEDLGDSVEGDGDDEWNAWDEEAPLQPGDSGYDPNNMPSDLRPPYSRDGKSQSGQPLLGSSIHNGYEGGSAMPGPRLSTRKSTTFRERDPEERAKDATRTRYTYAAGFLLLSLVSFAVQTETAVYIQHDLGWKKAYCMLYVHAHELCPLKQSAKPSSENQRILMRRTIFRWLTHGSWSLLWPTQLFILRLHSFSTPWPIFWRRHLSHLRTTAQMVQHQTLHLSPPQTRASPLPYLLKWTALVTCALTIAGGSWYVAVDLTTASDLTAIYNCSAFFAYAFSVPLLHERLRWSKVLAVGIAIAGVLVVAYGDSSGAHGDDPAVPSTPKHGSKSGGGAGGPSAPPDSEAPSRALGNIVIGIGSVLYGFYEVLYKKVACPPDGTNPTRGMIFANTFGSCIGAFTFCVLWIPLPLLHFSGIEPFELPDAHTGFILFISVVMNATFSGSFLVLISLTSPVLSSVAALLTIFIVAIIDVMLPPPLYSPISAWAITGGLLIILAFVMLSLATYREMDEERKKKVHEEIVEESDIDDV